MDLTIRLRATVSKISSGSCGLPEVAIWMPVAPTVVTLPAAPQVVQNQIPRPADSAPIPQDFNLESPDLCALFTSILSESSEPVYANELTTESLVLPFNETVEFEALIRPKVQVFRFPYSFDTTTVDVNIATKVTVYGAKLFKFVAFATSFISTYGTTFFRRTYVIRTETGLFACDLARAEFIPRVFRGETGVFELTVSDAALRIPGTFSYAWESTIVTSSSVATPINVWYRRSIHQLLYPYDILINNGMRPNALIRNIHWYVAGAVNATYRSTDFTIRMFHTSATSATSHMTPVSGTSKVTVFGPSNDSLFDTVGEVILSFYQEFEWNGVNGICIETCTSGNLSSYIGQGTMRVSSTVTAARRYYRDDKSNVSACETGTDTTANNYIAIKMDFG